MTYKLGGLSFATKQQVRTHASTVLNRAALGKVLQGADELFARELLAHHPEALRKQGAGVEAILVAHVAEWGTRNFIALRADGSSDAWSIKRCISNMRPAGR